MAIEGGTLTDRILVLTRNQVMDRAKGSFYVGLKDLKRKHMGLSVYEDRCGRRIAIRESAAR